MRKFSTVSTVGMVGKLSQILLTASMLLAIGCGKPSGGTPVQAVPIQPGDRNAASQLKTLPTFQPDELKLRLLEELMRAYQSALYLEAPPAKPDSTQGCLLFKHYAKEPSLRIFYDCSWPQLLAGQNLVWHLKNQEMFKFPRTNSDPSIAQAELVLLATKPATTGNKVTKVFQTRYSRIVTLLPGNGTRGLTVDTAMGNSKDNKGDYWSVHMSAQMNTFTSPPQLTVSQLTLTYRPADGATTSPTSVLYLNPKTTLTFNSATACKRPVGVFDWSLISGSQVDKGTISVNQNGISETSVNPAQTIAWPSSCIEYPTSATLD